MELRVVTEGPWTYVKMYVYTDSPDIQQDLVPLQGPLLKNDGR